MVAIEEQPMSREDSSSEGQSSRSWAGTNKRERCCYNCGLPDPGIQARVKLAVENTYRRSAVRALPFCNEECALQSMFLQLPTRSTRDSIARIQDGRAVSYAEFRSKVRVHGQTVTKTIAGTRINIDPEEAENEELTPEAHPGFLSRKGGRPRKYNSTDERQKAHAQRQRSYRERCRVRRVFPPAVSGLIVVLLAVTLLWAVNSYTTCPYDGEQANFTGLRHGDDCENRHMHADRRRTGIGTRSRSCGPRWT
jgi:hypothetical protein